MVKTIDCMVCGSCVVDLSCRPVNLDQPIGRGVLHWTEPIGLTGGGITCNAGITMARLGMHVGVLSYVGDDVWGALLRQRLHAENIDDACVVTHPTEPTSTTVVVINDDGERSFLHCGGAPKQMDGRFFLDRLDQFAHVRVMLLGYYSLMPRLEADLPQVLRDVRQSGCQTALDAAGTGGSMQPLDQLLPHLDYYVPSLAEASHQTGRDDPYQIIDTFRACGAPGLLGVKLGSRGALLSPAAEQYVQIDVVKPPGTVIDTTGAGDSFYGGLLSGLLKGLSLEQAGRLGAAAAAYCVTAMGGCEGQRDYEATTKLAGLS